MFKLDFMDDDCDIEGFLIEDDYKMNNTELFLKLVKENPELPILPMVSTDVVDGDYYGWWCGRFGESSVDYYYYNNEHCIIREYDDDYEIFEECFDINDFDENITDEEITKLVDTLNWTKAILVYIQ